MTAALPALLAGELAHPAREPWEERYTDDLLTAVLTGNDAMVARACLPLAFGEAAASRRALELATGVYGEAAASAAARCLALRR